MDQHNNFPSFWSKARFARAVAMAKDGYSSSQIAHDLGCTRNAVIGKLHRHEVKWKPHPNPRGKDRRSRARPRPIQVPVQPLEATMVKVVEKVKNDEIHWVKFRDLGFLHCRWPVEGEPGPDMLCCGAPRTYHESYCEYHADKGTTGGSHR